MVSKFLQHDQAVQKENLNLFELKLKKKKKIKCQSYFLEFEKHTFTITGY